ncbi:MAG TPA: hypothetical protein P5545_00865 [Bacteroidota bacterium]|jgi:hypothetical protein|nr:hypothetical protein [Bacteroidota bacterium]
MDYQKNLKNEWLEYANQSRQLHYQIINTTKKDNYSGWYKFPRVRWNDTYFGYYLIEEPNEQIMYITQ